MIAKIGQICSSIISLSFVFALYTSNSFPIVLVKKSSDMSRDLTEIDSVGLEVQTNNIKLFQTFQSTSRRTNIVINKITLLNEL